MICELIDTELEAVAGGLFNTNVVSRYIDAHQTASANANASATSVLLLVARLPLLTLAGLMSNVELDRLVSRQCPHTPRAAPEGCAGFLLGDKS